MQSTDLLQTEDGKTSSSPVLNTLVQSLTSALKSSPTKTRSIVSKNTQLLNKEISDLKSLIADLTNENMQLNQKIQFLTSENAMIKKMNAEAVLHFQENASTMMKKMREDKRKSPNTYQIEEQVDDKIKYLDDLNEKVKTSVKDLEDANQKRLKCHESDLLRIFNARLDKAYQEFEQVKQSKDKDIELLSKSGPWRQIEELQGTVGRIEDFNRQLIDENKELKSKIKDLTSDLETANVQIRKLKITIMKYQKKHTESLDSSPNSMLTKSQLTINTARLRSNSSVITDPLIQTIHSELKSAQSQVILLKSELEKINSRRTELEQILEECLNDVTKDVENLQARKGKWPVLTQTEREQLIGMLISKSRVIELIREKSFPKLSLGLSPQKWNSNPKSGSQSSRDFYKEVLPNLDRKVHDLGSKLMST
ncbi:unnamed protein product [Blepharisma stoltei]|uniref:Uncharacterized protein n=1 Tax=Blepharisma stoltei TaxID=1481888 RepID=A0AAU9JPI3_9CILI|nr:unnamed protein product [Blepharisma stoltei]